MKPLQFAQSFFVLHDCPDKNFEVADRNPPPVLKIMSGDKTFPLPANRSDQIETFSANILET